MMPNKAVNRTPLAPVTFDVMILKIIVFIFAFSLLQGNLHANPVGIDIFVVNPLSVEALIIAILFSIRKHSFFKIFACWSLITLCTWSLFIFLPLLGMAILGFSYLSNPLLYTSIFIVIECVIIYIEYLYLVKLHLRFKQKNISIIDISNLEMSLYSITANIASIVVFYAMAKS